MKRREEITQLIDKLAVELAEIGFTDEYKKSASLEKRKLEGMGMAIARWCSWNSTVVHVCFSALEAANFHSLTEALLEEIRLEASGGE